MDINLKNAVSHFFPNVSFEHVYFEAVANAIDAEATEISIRVSLASFDNPETLSIVITDNGEGFTDKNFAQFKSLLEVDNNMHKGLGRLVYLAYFGKVAVKSTYERTKAREFIFSNAFNGQSKVREVGEQPSETTLEFSQFAGTKVKSYDYLVPKQIKQSLIKQFLPLLFTRKKSKHDLTIKIELKTDTPNPAHEFVSGGCTLTASEVPDFKEDTFSDKSLDFYQSFKIHYRITHDLTAPKSVTSAICIDDRTVAYDLILEDSVPNGYQMVFLFSSEFFNGKADSTRQRLQLPETLSERDLKHDLRTQMALIIEREVPIVKTTNAQTMEDLHTRYPHLSGYFTQDTVGLIQKNEAIEIAQKQFFEVQRTILECENLDDTQYEQALVVSSRVLMEYILYRAQIIKKLKAMNPGNSEAEIHNIIIPQHKTYRGDSFIQDIYSNNVWMLDDKYMSYSTILSDEEMSKVIKVIAGEDKPVDGRPDITLVFSADPATTEKVDVVVIELKKHAIPLAKSEEVVSQLRQRARRLLKYYPDKINRMWFYGITEIDDEFRRSLKEDLFKELFSHGNMFYKPQPIIVDDENSPFPVDLFVLTYKAFIEDAESRNATFLQILKNSIRESAATSLPATGDP